MTIGFSKCGIVTLSTFWADAPTNNDDINKYFQLQSPYYMPGTVLNV